MKLITVVLILTFSLSYSTLTGQTSIQGRLLTSTDDKPISGEALNLYKNGVRLMTVYSDKDGYYHFSNIDPGMYNMDTGDQRAKCEPAYVQNIIAFAGQTVLLDFLLSPKSNILNCGMGIEYKVPLIPYDQTTSGTILTADQIRVRTKH